MEYYYPIQAWQTGDLLKDWKKSWEKEEDRWKMALKEGRHNYSARTTVKNIEKKVKENILNKQNLGKTSLWLNEKESN